MNKYTLNRISGLSSVVIRSLDKCLQSKFDITVRGHICSILAAQVQLNIYEIIFCNICVDVVCTLKRPHENDIIYLV
jgi:hypothetical protein